MSCLMYRGQKRTTTAVAIKRVAIHPKNSNPKLLTDLPMTFGCYEHGNHHDGRRIDAVDGSPESLNPDTAKKD